MTASDNLSSQLFHGTHASIPTDGSIQPRGRHNQWHQGYTSAPKGTGPVAFATPDLEEAKGFAAKGAEEHGHLFGPVYSVEKHEGDDTLHENSNKGSAFTREPHGENDYVKTNYVTSEKGFKVKKVVAWGIPGIHNRGY